MHLCPGAKVSLQSLDQGYEEVLGSANRHGIPRAECPELAFGDWVPAKTYY